MLGVGGPFADAEEIHSDAKRRHPVDHDPQMMLDNDPPLAAWSADDLARVLLAETDADRESIDAIAMAVAIAPVLDVDAPFDAALHLARRVRDVLVPHRVSPETVT